MHMLKDIRPFITRLNKVFRTESIDFSWILPMVSTTIDFLNEKLKTIGNTGIHVDKLKEFIREKDSAVKCQRPQSEN